MIAKSTVVTGRLLALLLLPVSFGCATGATTLQEQAPKEQVSAAPKEQVAPPKEQGGALFKDQKDKASYSLGLDIGNDIKQQEVEPRIDPLLQGIRDAVKGNKPLLSAEELEAARKAFIADRMAARAKVLGPQAEKNLAEGEAFLRENAKKPGVKTLPSGLQYRVLKEGEGNTPGPEKNVKAFYVVRALDGTELDSTGKTPAVFPLQAVIPAWTEALQLMKEGAKWELFSPSYLAYGDKGIGKNIGPFQALTFEIELIGIH